MRKNLTALLCILFPFEMKAQFQGLIVNEFSQGNTGNREYIELLVDGKRTCGDSTADLRGWIFDDQNGWYGTINSAAGHYRFSNILNWASVPFGSIILVYNSAAGEKNLSIHLPDDPTDSNKDLTYILPINSSLYIEQHNTEPGNFSGASYSYPDPSSTSGYLPSTNQWSFQISLNNNGDVISTVGPSKRDTAYFSIAYGYTIVAGFHHPTVSIINVPAGNNAYLSDENYTSPAGWIISPVPQNETPGLPNSEANKKWIRSMQRRVPPGIQNTIIDGCAFVFYNGKVYTSSVIIRDTVRSTVTACDSVIKAVNIVVYQKPQLKLSPDKIICAGSPVTLTASSNGAVQWLGLAQGSSITIVPSFTTTYTAVAISADGCTDTARTTVVVSDFKLLLHADPNPAIANKNVSLRTIANSPYRVLAWRPSNLFPHQSFFTQQLAADTSTTVTVTAKSNKGCFDSASVTIVIHPFNGNVFIPAAFTPNADGVNDLFRVLGGKFRTFDLKIYNRWGQLIFSTHDPSAGWDGSLAGKPERTGVYAYKMRAAFQNGLTIVRKGTLLLVR